jgi:hypothetical protein
LLFILRVDADIHTYTEMWSIVGVQKAKKKRDWIEVEIGIPEAWWKEGPTGYAIHLVEEIEKGLVSMVQLLQKKNRTSMQRKCWLIGRRSSLDILAARSFGKREKGQRCSHKKWGSRHALVICPRKRHLDKLSLAAEGCVSG